MDNEGVFRASQGSQPRFADVRVGIVRVAVRGDRRVVQLAVRSPRNDELRVVEEGQGFDLHGAGRLVVRTIEVPEAPARGRVTFVFEPAVARSAERAC